MEEIRGTLKHWSNNIADFDAKLVAREETGCCEAQRSQMGTDPGTGAASEYPCSE